MNKDYFSKRNLIFITIFSVLGLVALQIPVTKLEGSKAAFTLFDFFGPIATAFIGTIPGIIAVFLMQFLNFLLHGANVVDAGTIIRFFPMLFAAAYFGKKGKFNIIVPILAIVIFNLHPIGRSVWYFSLYWLIPIVCYFFRDRSLLARSLGATFTAHSVGGALWIHVFALPKAVWIGLIPIVAIERLLFAGGMAATYILMTNVVHYLTNRKKQAWHLPTDARYVWQTEKLLEKKSARI